METVTSSDLVSLAKGSVDRFRSIERLNYRLVLMEGIKNAIIQSSPRTRLYQPGDSEESWAFIINGDEKSSPGKYLVPIQPVLTEADKDTCLNFCIDYLIGCVDASLTRFKNTPQEVQSLGPVQKRDFLTALIQYYDEIEQKEGFGRIESMKKMRPLESFLKSYPDSIQEFMELNEQYNNREITPKEFYEGLEGIESDYLSFPAQVRAKMSAVNYLKILGMKNPCYLLFLGVEAAPERPIFGPAMRFQDNQYVPLTHFIYLPDSPKDL